MPFNDGFSTQGIPYTTGSNGQVLTWSEAQGSWIAADSSGEGGGTPFLGVVLGANSNLEGVGTLASPLRVVDNTFLTSVTSSFKGDGSQLTNLPLSEYAKLTEVSSSFARLAAPSNNFVGSVTASYFVGDGSNLTNVNASDIVTKAINKTGTDISKSFVVHITASSNSSDTPHVTLADWTGDSLSANTLGLAYTNILNNNTGSIITEGVITGVNISHLTSPESGQTLYLSSSGQFTNIKPVAPKHTVSIGQIIRSSPINNASIYVAIQNGYELQELHDVLINGTTTGDLLVKDGSLWKNSKVLSGSYEIINNLTASNISASSVIYGDGSGIINVPPRDLIALTQLSSSALVTYTVPSSTTFTAVNLNSDGTNRYAKVTFTAPKSGKVSIQAKFDMIISNSAAVQMIGLHNSSASTTTPSAGWYRINADNDSTSGQFYAIFNLFNLTPDITYTYYLMSVCNFAGNLIRISNVQAGAYSSGADLPAPLMMFVYNLGSVSVLQNPNT